MRVNAINRVYLETLSFSDLVRLADEYGLDVPDSLDRRFLIEELIETSKEENSNSDNMIVTSQKDDIPVPDEEKLPKNYNETQINCVLRNPSWGFVFWNIRDTDMLEIKSIPGSSLMLRVIAQKDLFSPETEESFEVKTVSSVQEQYVLLPQDKKYIKIELICVAPGYKKILSISPVITIPQGSSYVSDLQLGRDSDFSEIIKLSGMEKVLMNQYKNQKHSF